MDSRCTAQGTKKIGRQKTWHPIKFNCTWRVSCWGKFATDLPSKNIALTTFDVGQRFLIGGLFVAPIFQWCRLLYLKNSKHASYDITKIGFILQEDDWLHYSALSVKKSHLKKLKKHLFKLEHKFCLILWTIFGQLKASFWLHITI